MFRPIEDIMFLKRVEMGTIITAPRTTKTGTGDTFEVLAVGPGCMMDNGQIYAPDVRVGDKVWTTGEIIKLPDHSGHFLARARDVVAVERSE